MNIDTLRAPLSLN